MDSRSSVRIRRIGESWSQACSWEEGGWKDSGLRLSLEGEEGEMEADSSFGWAWMGPERATSSL